MAETSETETKTLDATDAPDNEPSTFWPSMGEGIGALLFVLAARWLVTMVFFDQTGDRLAAAGNAVAAIGTLAAVGATFFALKQLELQRQVNKDEARDSLLREFRCCRATSSPAWGAATPQYFDGSTKNTSTIFLIHDEVCLQTG